MNGTSLPLDNKYRNGGYGPVVLNNNEFRGSRQMGNSERIADGNKPEPVYELGGDMYK